MRWIWIDKFLEFRSGQFARAIKNLTLAEEHLHDHFPGYPVMPASLIIEGLAQTGGILVGEAGGFAEKVVLAKIPRADFLGVACAGDQLIYEVTLKDLRSEGAVVEAKAFLDGELLVDAEIVFAHLDNSAPTRFLVPRISSSLSSFWACSTWRGPRTHREANQARGRRGGFPINGQPHDPPSGSPEAWPGRTVNVLRNRKKQGNFRAWVEFVSRDVSQAS